MILVTGATGTIGSRLLPLLAAREAPVRAMTRDPRRLRPAPGVDVVQGDFDDTASLASAIAGIDTLFLLTAPTAPSARHDLAMLDAALVAGVTRVVRLSAIGTGETYDSKTVGAAHAEADEAVQASGMAWTLLRPTTFASNTLWWADAIKTGKPVMNMLGDGAQGVVDPADVAAVAAEVLSSAAHSGNTYTLTGPDLLTIPDQAALIEQALGRPIQLVDTPPQAARAQMLASGMHPLAVDQMIIGSAWARAGHNATITDDVTKVLHRPPTPFTTWLADNLTAFTNGDDPR